MRTESDDWPCPSRVWSERIGNIMGAQLGNIDRSDRAGPGPGQPPRPWQPWADDVMILAGLCQSLTEPGGSMRSTCACRLCGWFLGYSPQCTPQYLLEQAQAHKAACEESQQHTRQFYAEHAHLA